jgi:hypothetical protein
MAWAASVAGLLLLFAGVTMVSVPLSLSGTTVGVAIVRVADRRAPRVVGALAVVTGAVGLILMASELLGGR